MDSTASSGSRALSVLKGNLLENFETFESEFLKLLAKDIEEAGSHEGALLQGLEMASAPESARIRRLLGRLYLARGRSRKAILETRKALKIFLHLGMTTGQHQCYLTLVDIYTRRGNYDKARQFAQTLIDQPQCPDDYRIKACVNLGNLEHRRRRYTDAHAHFSATLRYLDANPDARIEAIVRHNLGCLEVCLNRFNSAITNFRRALGLFVTLDAKLYQAHVHQAMSEVYAIQGLFDEAQSHLKHAREIYTAGSDHVGAAYCELESFTIDTRLRPREQALDRIDAIAIEFDRFSLTYEKAQLLFEAARLALDCSELDVADEYLAESRQLFKREKNEFYLSLCDFLQARLSIDLGFPQKGARLVARAEAYFKRNALAEHELKCILLRAQLNPDQIGQQTTLRMRRLLHRTISLDLRVQTLTWVASRSYIRGQRKRAIQHLMEAISLLEESRANIQPKDLRMGFFDSKTEIYETLIRWLFEHPLPDSQSLIFQAIELSRSRELYDSMSATGSPPPAVSVDEPTMVELNRFHERMEQLERRLIALPVHAQVTESKSIQQELEQTKLQYRSFKSKIRDHRRLAVYFPFKWDLSQLQQRIPADTLVVSYFMTHDRLYRVELSHDRLTRHQLALSPEIIRDIQILPRYLASAHRCTEANTLAMLERVSQVLIPKSRKRYKTLIFIPHKHLQHFPFSALRHRSGYLIDSHCIMQCPNLPILYFGLDQQEPQTRSPLFFFSDDPSDPKASERHTLLRLMPHAKTRRDLIEPDLVEDLVSADLIHFAGHGVFSAKEPGRSHLRLAQHQLTLTQVSRLRLNQPFVNLAACRSGSLALAQGNELQGFVVSFFAAGAASVLGSLWDIEDEATSEWMCAFYQNLSELGCGEAYRQACLAIQSKHNGPYAWAGFTLFGALPRNARTQANNPVQCMDNYAAG